MAWPRVVVLLTAVVCVVAGVSLKCGEDIIVSRGQKKVLRFWSSEDEFLNVDIIPKRNQVRVGGGQTGEKGVEEKGGGGASSQQPQGDLYYSAGPQVTTLPPTTVDSLVESSTRRNQSSEKSEQEEDLGVNTVFLDDSIVYDYKTADDYDDSDQQVISSQALRPLTAMDKKPHGSPSHRNESATAEEDSENEINGKDKTTQKESGSLLDTEYRSTLQPLLEEVTEAPGLLRSEDFTTVVEGVESSTDESLKEESLATVEPSGIREDAAEITEESSTEGSVSSEEGTSEYPFKDDSVGEQGVTEASQQEAIDDETFSEDNELAEGGEATEWPRTEERQQTVTTHAPHEDGINLLSDSMASSAAEKTQEDKTETSFVSDEGDKAQESQTDAPPSTNSQVESLPEKTENNEESLSGAFEDNAPVAPPGSTRKEILIPEGLLQKTTAEDSTSGYDITTESVNEIAIDRYEEEDEEQDEKAGITTTILPSTEEEEELNNEIDETTKSAFDESQVTTVAYDEVTSDDVADDSDNVLLRSNIQQSGEKTEGSESIESSEEKSTEKSEMVTTTDSPNLLKDAERFSEYAITENSQLYDFTEKSEAFDTTERAEIPPTETPEIQEGYDTTELRDVLDATDRTEVSETTEMSEVFDVTERSQIPETEGENNDSLTTESPDVFDTKERSELSATEETDMVVTTETPDSVDERLATESPESDHENEIRETTEKEEKDQVTKAEKEQTTERFIFNEINAQDIPENTVPQSASSDGLLETHNQEFSHKDVISPETGDFSGPNYSSNNEINPYLGTIDYDETTLAPRAEDYDQATTPTEELIKDLTKGDIGLAEDDDAGVTDSPYRDEMTTTTQETTMAGGFKVNEEEDMSVSDPSSEETSVTEPSSEDQETQDLTTTTPTDVEEDMTSDSPDLMDGPMTEETDDDVGFFDQIIDSLTEALENIPENIHVPVGDLSIDIKELLEIANGKNRTGVSPNTTSAALPVEHRDKISLTRSENVTNEEDEEVKTTTVSDYVTEGEGMSESLSMAGFIDQSEGATDTTTISPASVTDGGTYDYPDVVDEDDFKGYDYYESLVDSLMAQEGPFDNDENVSSQDESQNSVTTTSEPEYVQSISELSEDDVAARPESVITMTKTETKEMTTMDMLPLLTTLSYDLEDQTARPSSSEPEASETTSSENKTETTTLFSIPYLILQNQAMLNELLANQNIPSGSHVIIKEQGSKVAVSSPSQEDSGQDVITPMVLLTDVPTDTKKKEPVTQDEAQIDVPDREGIQATSSQGVKDIVDILTERLATDTIYEQELTTIKEDDEPDTMTEKTDRQPIRQDKPDKPNDLTDTEAIKESTNKPVVVTIKPESASTVKTEEPTVQEESTEFFWNFVSQKGQQENQQPPTNAGDTEGSDMRRNEAQKTETKSTTTTSEPDLATILLPSSFIDRLGEASDNKAEEVVATEAEPPTQVKVPGILSRKDDEGFTDYGGDSPFFIKLPGSPNAVPVYIQYEPVQVKYVPATTDVEARETVIQNPVTSESDVPEQRKPDYRESTTETNPTTQVIKEDKTPAADTPPASTDTVRMDTNADGTPTQAPETQQPQENSLLSGIYRILDDVASSVNRYPQNPPHNAEGPGFKPNRPVVHSPDPFFLMEAPQLGSPGKEAEKPSPLSPNVPSASTHTVHGSSNGFSVDVSSQFGFGNTETGSQGVRAGTVDDVPIGVKNEVLYPGDYYRHDAYTGLNLHDLANPVFNLRTKATTPSPEDLLTPEYTPFPITTNPPRTTTTFAPLSALPLSTSFQPESAADPEADRRYDNVIYHGEDKADPTTPKPTSDKPPPSVEFSPIPSIDFADSYDGLFLPEAIYGKDTPDPFPMEQFSRDQAAAPEYEDAGPEANQNNGFFAAPFKTSHEGGFPVERKGLAGTSHGDESPSSGPFAAPDQMWSFPKSRDDPGLGFPQNAGREYSAFHSPREVPGFNYADFSYRKVPGVAPSSPAFRKEAPVPSPLEDTGVEFGFPPEEVPPQLSKSDHGLLLGPEFFDYLNRLPYPLLQTFLNPKTPERLKRSAPREGEQIFCEWNIKTEPGLYLLMTFHNLSAAYTVDCHGAYIEVERENNGYDARWCGNRVSLAGSRPHVIFAKTEVRITVYDDGAANKFLPTGFEADIEVIDLFDPNEYSSFMKSDAYPRIHRLLLG